MSKHGELAAGRLNPSDRQCLAAAIRAARAAKASGDDPYGAAVASGSILICSGHNTVASTHDPSAHAELIVIRRASALRHMHKLAGLTLYTTCEPCPMCWGLILWSGISRVVIGAKDPVFGATGVSFPAFAAPEIVYADSTACRGLLRLAAKKWKEPELRAAAASDRI